MRASLRGIDLILEQGMNVKVVTFPDGDDPDSFAKKNSDAELKQYLEEKQQDFIGFKVSLLMQEAKNDPVKKAGLIRDIVTSISKIPDGIQREVYVQECARIMDISERVLFSELAQLLNKDAKETAKHQRTQPVLTPVQEVKKPKVDSLLLLEKEIIRILLLYGNEEIDFVNWVDAEDKKGQPILEKEEYTNTVSNELYLNLQDDEIEFTNQTFKEVYHELIHQLNQDEKISIDKLVSHQNPNISSLVTDILMNEERYSLSDWKRKEIFVTETRKVLPKLVSDAMLNLRRVLIEKKINGILHEIKNEQITPDLEEIKNYTELKKKLFDKLNRVV